MEKSIQYYLKQAQSLEINPNFYTSLPYLELFEAECIIKDSWIWLEAENWILLPPLPLVRNALDRHYPRTEIWSSFSSMDVSKFHYKEFLDWQYVFDPKAFNDLSGGSWNVYRKNIRKYPKRHERWLYTVENTTKTEEILDLVWKWIENKGDTVLDAEFILKYLSNSDRTDIHKAFLYQDKELVAVNAWDENWKYINYRFCITKPNEPFLEEFVRYLFYGSPVIQDANKLVNDGGSLGNSGLESFKNKMNPLSKTPIFTLRF